jgi:hypothetical protein
VVILMALPSATLQCLTSAACYQQEALYTGIIARRALPTWTASSRCQRGLGAPLPLNLSVNCPAHDDLYRGLLSFLRVPGFIR